MGRLVGWIWLSSLVLTVANYHQVQANPDQVHDKLDKILQLVQRLSLNQDELNRTLGRQSCDCTNIKQVARLQEGLETKVDLVERKAGLFVDASTQTDQSILNDRHLDDQVSSIDGHSSTTTTSTITTSEQQVFKRESKTPQDDNVLSKDLFHINKLAESTNSIAMSSMANMSPHSSYASTVLNGHINEQPLALLLAQYDALFRESLENMRHIMKEQLAGFRLTLNKLMNRIADHNYQHNLLSNQLLSVKDECSLAAVYSGELLANQSSLLMSTSCRSIDSTVVATTKQPPADQTGAASPGAAQLTLRSSDVTMIVRLLSQELDQLMQSKSSRSRNGRLDSLSQQEDEHRHDDEQLESFIAGDFKQTQRRIDEIDSVVKQTALLLSKYFHNYSPQLPAASTDNLHTFVVTNNNDSLPVRGHHQDQQLSANKTRWFSGSKVPNRLPAVPADSRQIAGPLEEPLQVAKPRCQAKTQLVRPTSCRQLRLAGANCTGQYYVFVRGSIRHVYCDMNMDSQDDGGGWTVVMRRIDKSFDTHLGQQQHQATRTTNQFLEAFKASQVNFNLDWANYKSGFGHFDVWSEFFIGLDLLHQLTSDNGTAELQVDLVGATNETIQEALHLRFEQFHVENETSNYRLHVGGCNATRDLCEPISLLNGARFYTFDRPAGSYGAQNCSSGLPETAGWWAPLANTTDCQRTTTNISSIRSPALRLTDPIGKMTPASGGARHLYWPTWRPEIPLRYITMKVRNKSTA